jgi:hypothetical protein
MNKYQAKRIAYVSSVMNSPFLSESLKKHIEAINGDPMNCTNALNMETLPNPKRKNLSGQRLHVRRTFHNHNLKR